jgi:hypothetical protein
MSSVAIIGSGPSGLAAADRLAEAQFQVTVFEKEGEAGGKVKTIRIGDYFIDIGAIAGARRVGPFATDYDPIFALSDRYGIATRRFADTVTYDIDRGTHHFGVRLRDAIAVAPSLARYLLLHALKWRGHKRGEIGDDLSSELRMPWSELLKARGLGEMARVFQTLLTSAGYAPDMAAFHQASYFDPGLIFSVIARGGVESWVGGYQAVFKRLQAELADRGVVFRFHHQVRAIVRGANGRRPSVTANGERREFDHVFVACDVGPLLRHGVLEVSEDLRAILDQLHEVVDYRSIVCRIRGLPDCGRYSLGHVPAHSGHPTWPVMYCQQAPGLYTFYVEGTDRATGRRAGAEEIEANLRATVARLMRGAVLEKIEHYAEWEYAPHARAEAVRAGVLDRLKELQGKEGLAFLLAAASFETTARVMQNARAVTERLLPSLSAARCDPST